MALFMTGITTRPTRRTVRWKSYYALMAVKITSTPGFGVRAALHLELSSGPHPPTRQGPTVWVAIKEIKANFPKRDL